MGAAHYVFAGGGSGGHLYPGLAVAAAVHAIDPAARITFFTTPRALDRELLARTAFAQVPQPVRPLSLKPWRWAGFWFAWRASLAGARRFLREQHVRGVLGLGGYAAGPAVHAAHTLGIHCGILNPDAIPGRANRYLASRVDFVALQWDESRRHLPPRAPCETLGCPIRAAFSGASAEAGRALFGLSAEKRTLLVTGASQGARTINEALTRLWPTFAARHPDWQLLHLTGREDEAATRAAYAGAQVDARVMAFTHDMPQALAAADLVIARAGASTLAELTALGRASILLPYPFHKDRHQHANAQVLVDAGAARLVEDTRSGAQNAAALLPALEALCDSRALAAMSDAARRIGRGDAAAAIARRLLAPRRR